MKTEMTREKALVLLKKYNQEAFHILHGLTVEGVMRYYARELGCSTTLTLNSTRRSTVKKRRSSFWREARRRS